MSATQQQVQTAAKLYEARDAVRRLLGDGFKAAVAKYAYFIRLAESEGRSTLEAGLHLAKTAGLSAEGRVMVLAATVELIEPTP
jgi:hypothetical protein